ncbi:MAG: ExbD/TolR family protein [Acidobacteriota bacterium]
MTSGRGGTRSNVTSDINVTPMADVMLVLLIIFMITTPLLQEGVFVNKAKAKNPQEATDVEGKDATTVTITRKQEIYVNQNAVAPDNLIDTLTERYLLAADKPLFVKSDVAAPYGTVVDVVNKARDAGYKRIGLLVDRQSAQER